LDEWKIVRFPAVNVVLAVPWLLATVGLGIGWVVRLYRLYWSPAAETQRYYFRETAISSALFCFAFGTLAGGVAVLEGSWAGFAAGLSGGVAVVAVMWAILTPLAYFQLLLFRSLGSWAVRRLNARGLPGNDAWPGLFRSRSRRHSSNNALQPPGAPGST
jgi:hypothetical protein